MSGKPAPDDPRGAVSFAYLHSNEMKSSWHHSVIGLLAYDVGHEMRVMRGGWNAIRCGTGGLVESRNLAIRTFLEEQRAEWLFWVDTDMGFEPDTIDRLLEVADPVERPIVGGLCFMQQEREPDGMGGYHTLATPTIYDWTVLNGKHGFKVRWDYTRDALVRCAGTGSACILIHRSALEKVAEKCGPTWYERVPNTDTNQLISEDLSFCLRAGALNIPVHVHTGVKTTHAKEYWLGEDTYLLQRGAVGVPLATEETAVLVPVLGRPGNAAPFMATLRATSGLAHAYAIVGSEETAEATQASAKAWADAGATVIASEKLTFAEKVNEGYRRTSEPWLFLTGDDVRFHAGWLDHAQTAAKVTGAQVVGTNDLGNPRVMAGDHATHMLVRRRYVDRHGGSWDGPGVLAHEGFRHWYVDDEIVTAAKERGVWQMALASHVEHLHPAWEKGAMDATYELGRQSVEQDQALFVQRKADHAAKPEREALHAR